MSLTLTCDSCGASISQGDLKEGRAFEHEGTHYCERCKAPILAFLKKSGREPAPSAAPPAPAKAQDPLAGLKDLEDFEEQIEELESKISSTGAPKAPPAAGAQKRPAPPAKPGLHRPPLPVRPQLPAKASPAPGAAGGPRKPSAGGAAPPAKAPAAGGGLPRRGAPIPGRLASRIGGAQKGRPVAPIERLAPPAEEALTEVQVLEGEGAPRKKKIFLISGICAGVALLALVLVLILKGGPKPSGPSQELASPAAESKKLPEAAKESLLELEKRRELDGLRLRLSDDPEKLLALNADLNSFIPLESLSKDHESLFKETEKRIEAAKQRILKDTLTKSQEYQKKENFEAAAVLWQTPPEIILRSDLRSKWIEEGEKAARLGAAWALWAKIDEKVDKYLAQDDYEISIAILACEDNLPNDCEKRFPLLWAKREERLSDLRVNREKVRKEIHDRIVARQEKEKQLEQERKRKEREQDWLDRLSKTPPVPLISEYGNDLENWTHRPAIMNRGNIFDSRVPWSIQSIEGRPTLVANGEEQEVEIGVNGNRWLDWVLEFEVRVKSGSLHLKTRTKVVGQVLISQITEEGPKRFDFLADNYGTWTRFRVEARVDKVSIYEGPEKKLTMEIETKETEHQDGGFAFSLDPKGSAEIRNVQLQLIHDSKRPREEEEEGE